MNFFLKYCGNGCLMSFAESKNIQSSLNTKVSLLIQLCGNPGGLGGEMRRGKCRTLYVNNKYKSRCVLETWS